MILGTWDVTIKTPIGSLAVEYVFTPDGAGVATYRNDVVPLRDIAVCGQQVTWRQTITKPIRLNLDFEVTVDGDRMDGHSRAGRLPKSAVTGARRPTR